MPGQETRGRAVLAWGAAIGIALAAAAVVHDHTRGDSASSDEPVHLVAGYLQVRAHTALANIEHPPLVKEAAGLALLALGPQLRDVRLRPGVYTVDLARELLFHSRATPDRILAAGRAPMLLFFLALLLLTFGAARRLYGTRSAFFALGLLAFEPGFLAHAGIVHTDVPAALFWLAGVLLWMRLLRKPSIPNAIFAGLGLGGGLATKFSTLYLLPTFALLAAAYLWGRARQAPRGEELALFARSFAAHAAAGALAVAVAVATLAAAYQPCVSGVTPEEEQQVIRYMVGRGQPDYRPAEVLARLAPHGRGLALFAAGAASVWRQNSLGGSLNYLNGVVSSRGFLSYFFVAFLLKSTLPFLILVLAALIALFLGPRDWRDLLLWLPVGYYFFFSATSNYNIGVRHILPVYPFLAIAVSKLLVAGKPPAGTGSGRARRAKGAVLAALLALHVAASLRSHPHELGYFNALAGGYAGGSRILSDSNADWGLDLRRLADELRRRGARECTVAYFGGDDVRERIGVPDFVESPVLRGRLVAVSSTFLAEGPAHYAFFGQPQAARRLAQLLSLLRRNGRRAGRVGSIELFDLPETVSVAPGVPHAQLDLLHRAADELDRPRAMPSPARGRRLQLAAGRVEVAEGVLHVRLRRGAAGGEGQAERGGAEERPRQPRPGEEREPLSHSPPHRFRTNWIPSSTCPIASSTSRSARSRCPPLLRSVIASSPRAALSRSSAERMCGWSAAARPPRKPRATVAARSSARPRLRKPVLLDI